MRPARFVGKNTRDGRGRVRVTVLLYDRKIGNPIKGNIVRVVSVRDATVSEVVERVKRALFPNGP